MCHQDFSTREAQKVEAQAGFPSVLGSTWQLDPQNRLAFKHGLIYGGIGWTGYLDVGRLALTELLPVLDGHVLLKEDGRHESIVNLERQALRSKVQAWVLERKRA